MLRKKYLKIMIIILVLVLGVGCSDKSYEEYQKAVDKTENIERGKYDFDIEYNTKFNKEVLTVEDFKEAMEFSNIRLSGVNIYDKSNDGVNTYANIEVGNIGIDLEYYQNSEDKYLKIPFLGKFINLNNFETKDLSNDFDFNEDMDMNFDFDEETFYAIGSLWNEAIKEENVFKGQNSLLETPDGDVKVTEYSIKFSDELLKELMKETLEILNLSDSASFLDEITIDEFKYQAFVDIDGYIINENFGMSYTLDNEREIDSGQFKFEITNYDINDKQVIEIPKVEEHMLLDLDNMDELLDSTKELN